jgi:septum formation protein
VPFEVVEPEVEELEQGDPEEVAVENARRKAGAVQGELVLGVDTVVALGGRLYGKPATALEARETLRALSGRTHKVVSGLCLVRSGRADTATATTLVEFRTLDGQLIDWYEAGGEWHDRAGGYAIQGRGAALVARIEGDYFNVVGLPVATLVQLAPELLWR